MPGPRGQSGEGARPAATTSLPITTIFDAKTLAELAAVLEQKVRIPSLVSVQTEGAKPPLFMAHSYLLYHGLSTVLGKSQPFYGLRETEADGDLSIDDRARLYIADMRRVQPRRPCRVAGWCAVGPLVVEIARQLLLQGEIVKSLLLFDAWLPEYFDEVQRTERSRSPLEIVRDKLTQHTAKTEGLSWSGRFTYLDQVVRRIGKRHRDNFYVRHWAHMKRLSEMLHIALPQFMHNTTIQTLAAMRQFRADLLPLRITLLRAMGSQHLSTATDGCGWERVAGAGVSVRDMPKPLEAPASERVAGAGVSVLWAPGDHETMFRVENLRITGQLVQSALDAAS